MMKSPQTVQTTMDMLTEPVETSTPVGETKMPEPMMQPTITVQPFSRVISLLSLMSSSPPSPPALSIFLQMAIAQNPFQERPHQITYPSTSSPSSSFLSTLNFSFSPLLSKSSVAGAILMPLLEATDPKRPAPLLLLPAIL